MFRAIYSRKSKLPGSAKTAAMNIKVNTGPRGVRNRPICRATRYLEPDFHLQLGGVLSPDLCAPENQQPAKYYSTVSRPYHTTPHYTTPGDFETGPAGCLSSLDCEESIDADPRISTVLPYLYEYAFIFPDPLRTYLPFSIFRIALHNKSAHPHLLGRPPYLFAFDKPTLSPKSYCVCFRPSHSVPQKHTPDSTNENISIACLFQGSYRSFHDLNLSNTSFALDYLSSL